MRTTAAVLLSVLSLAVFLPGCRKEDDAPVPGREACVSLRIDLPENPLSKTALGERSGNIFPLLWSEGDRLSLNGTMSSPLAAGDAGKRSAPFTFRGTIRSPFNVLYPATAQADKVVFPGAQQYVAGSFDPAALPMWASSGSFTDATMHHLGTLLGFPFTGAGSALKQMIVMSMDGMALSGTFTLEKDAAGSFTGAFASREGASTATLDFPSGGLALGTDPVTVWISVPAGTYPSGFVTLVVDNSDNAMMLSFLSKETSSHMLQPGQALLFPATAYNPGAGLFLIEEPEDLVLLSQEPTLHPEVLMVKDVDMSQVKGWTPIEGFNGLFNGAGHVISGLDKAVFGTLEGEVRNLQVEADISSTAVMTAGIAHEIASGAQVSSSRVSGQIAYSGKNDQDVYLGGIAAKCFGTVRASSVNVNLTVASSSTFTALYAGGIAGSLESDKDVSVSGLHTGEESSMTLAYPKSGAPQLKAGGLYGQIKAPNITVSDCSSNTDISITVASGASSSKMLVGGIVGHAHSEANARVCFSDCQNKGSISAEGKGAIGENSVIARPSSMGGIVGKCQISGSDDSSEAVFDGCVNDGDLSLNSATGSTSVYAKITYLAGICGDAIAGHITDTGCVNNGNITVSGYTDRIAIAGHLGIIWRVEGSKTVLALSGKGDVPVNTGQMLYKDETKCMKHPVGGGVVGQIMAQEAVPLEFSIKDCSNSGMIDRSSPPSASFTIAADHEASAGGILGNIGFVSSTPNYSFVSGTVENCSNSAQITINAYAGETTILEKTTNQSFLGGIVGFSYARGGLVTIKDCRNSGYMRITAGNAGGILGRIQGNTVVTGSKTDTDVTYTLNSGRVGEFDLSLPTSYVSTGYSITGGIVGAMIFDDPDDVSKIEYCHNAGDISGCHRKSDGAGTITRPTVGGIIGQYDAGRSYAAVRYCKNSGHVRSYRAASSSSTWQYSGMISGSYPEDETTAGRYAIVRDCGVGGVISRASWIVPTDAEGEYPFHDYIYCFLILTGNDKYPPTTPEGTGFAEGCVVWDGISKLPWEE